MKQSIYDYSYEMREQRKKRVLRILAVVFSIVTILCIVLNFLLFPVYVRSDSMEENIASSSTVFVSPLDKTPERGQVFYISRLDGRQFSFFEKTVNFVCRLFTAQFYSPFDYTKASTGHESIRRVLAVPGDTIYMKDYILFIKPAGESHFYSEFEIAKKPYNIRLFEIPDNWDSLGSSASMDEMTLGKDQYFVLADNRIQAVDSRHYGPVASERFLGKVLLEYFPLKKIKVF